jgi:hypothetical protein
MTIPNMTVPDGSGSSPDGGAFWAKDNIIYWHDGAVTHLARGGLIRVSYCGGTDGEDYSAWTDEKRAEVLAKATAEWEADHVERLAEFNVRTALRRSAKAKLTPEEISACHLDDEDSQP